MTHRNERRIRRTIDDTPVDDIPDLADASIARIERRVTTEYARNTGT
ncbi:hypothetical protein ZOD2009_05592 [Haladaptatus paucihalophilus DX253]|uniref:Uncharacterized protein n=1 Tax=Haladaptatus paucihalophilus DX253 TaxID=797209 RepID=E7QQP8_HALPU|nr:hypothetical protein ZOD2009_05592 [Haladaptatus paucihalophilus DX253]